VEQGLVAYVDCCAQRFRVPASGSLVIALVEGKIAETVCD
jgi:hypothetical protein